MSSRRCGRARRGAWSGLRPWFTASELLTSPPSWESREQPNLARHACLSLPISTSNHSTGLSARLITEARRRAESDSWERRLCVHVCHLFMDRWARFDGREPSDRALLAELCRVFPPQPSELALHAVCRCGFVLSIGGQQRDPFLRCRVALCLSSSDRLAHQGRRLMRRTSRGGWLSCLVAKRPKERVWHTKFEAKNRKLQPKTTQKPAGYGLQTLVRARGPELPDTTPRAAEFEFCFRGCSAV